MTEITDLNKNIKIKKFQDTPLNSDFTVILYYLYTNIDDVKDCKTWQESLCKRFDLTGRIRIAKEGINSTLEGKNENIEKYILELKKYKYFDRIQVKKSIGTGESFKKISIKIVDEIVRLSLKNKEDIDPNIMTGHYLKPEEFRNMYEKNDDFVVIDMRNDYEFKVGHFKNSINPSISKFREIADVLPDILEKNPNIKNKKVVTVCTGGVRCEKASGYLIKKGFKDVYQLDGGMHMYMQNFPGKDFLGGLFTFDNRVVMNFGGENGKEREIIGICDFCQCKTERFDNCFNDECHIHILVCLRCRENTNFIFCSEKCKKEGRTGKIRFKDLILD